METRPALGMLGGAQGLLLMLQPPQESESYFCLAITEGPGLNIRQALF